MPRKSKKNVRVERTFQLGIPDKLVTYRSLFFQSLGLGVRSRGLNWTWGGASDQVFKEKIVVKKSKPGTCWCKCTPQSLLESFF